MEANELYEIDKTKGKCKSIGLGFSPFSK